MQYGTDHERDAVATFCAKFSPLMLGSAVLAETGCHLIDDDGRPFLCVSPDGLIVEEAKGRPRAIYEAKCRYPEEDQVGQIYYSILAR